MSARLVLSLLSIVISVATIVLNVIMHIRLSRREKKLERSMSAETPRGATE